MPVMASSQMPPTESSRASGLEAAFQKPAGKAGGDRVHAGGAEQVGRRHQERAAGLLVEQLQRAGELPAQRGRAARLQPQLRRRLPASDARRQLVGGLDVGGAGARRAAAPRPGARGPPPAAPRAPSRPARSLRSWRGSRRAPPRGSPPARPCRCPRPCSADRSPRRRAARALASPISSRHRLVEALGAQAVAGAVRRLALDAVLPALAACGRRPPSAARCPWPGRGAGRRRPAGSRGRWARRRRSSRAGGRARPGPTGRSRPAACPRGSRGRCRWTTGSSRDGGRRCPSEAVPAAARASATRPGVRPPSPSMMCTRGALAPK